MCIGRGPFGDREGDYMSTMLSSAMPTATAAAGQIDEKLVSYSFAIRAIIPS